MDILIEESDGCLWAASLKNGKLSGLEIDPINEQVRWGNIYRARVKTLDPARDAAYIDLDGTNTGILFNKDLRFRDENGDLVKGGDVAISKTLTPGETIIVQAKTAYLSTSEDQYTGTENKIPQLSMDITLQGRHLIYCPMMDKNRLSQRISNKKLRKQIKAMMQEMEDEQDIQGIILRAAAANTQTDILRREAEILDAAWNQILEIPEEPNAHLLIEGPDAIQRILSDSAADHIDAIEITIMDHFEHVESWSSIFAPDLVTKITPIELSDANEDLALYHERDIMGQIESLFQPYSMLSRGANLIIQDTAALTAIDVNKGGDDRAHLATNLEATIECFRQLRLRNIGGVIMIDLINCKTKKEQEAILNAANEEAAKDPCTIQIHGFTGTGLLEITRKRRTPALDQRIDLANI